MKSLSPLQTLLFGIAQIGIGIGILFLPLSFHVVAWVLILFGSMIIFLAIYLWFAAAIHKSMNEITDKTSK